MKVKRSRLSTGKLVYAAWTEGPTKGRDTNTAVGLCNNPSEQVSISQNLDFVLGASDPSVESAEKFS